MCREGAGIELTVPVTSALVYTTQDARIYINPFRQMMILQGEESVENTFRCILFLMVIYTRMDF